jgi:opacity protein-like surface antigen
MGKRLILRAALAASAALASAAEAQVAEREFSITPRAGYMTFDRASSIEDAATLGLDAIYNVNRYFGIGTGLTYARPGTRGEDFIARLNYGLLERGDTSFFYAVSQPLNVLDLALNATLRLPLAGRISPFVTGGAGVYAVFLDPQVNRGNDKFSRMSFNVGGGVNVRLGERVGLQLDARNVTFMNYDRERLRPTDVDRFAGNPLFTFQNYEFPNAFPQPPEAKSTVNNLSFNFGFNYTPRRGGAAEGGSEDTQ